MRDDYPRRGRTALTWLLSAIAAGFILEAVFERMFASSAFTQWFELSFGGVRHGLLWQVITYSFIHPLDDVLSVLTVAINMLCLYVLGREMESLLGARRFFVLYFGAVAAGAFFWLGANYNWGGVLTGAWPGILGCLTMYACVNPDEKLRLLVMFALPVTIRPRYLVWFLFALSLCGMVFWELRGQALPLQYSPSAHLGGIVAGFLYYQLVHKREWKNPDGRGEIELPRWMKRQKSSKIAEQPKYTVNLSSPADLKSEVDRILDKINSQGFGSLTPDEKRLLDDARDQLSKH
jgi:membrane associated rhomboid family serine protease